MNNGIVDTKVHLLRAGNLTSDNRFELLGTSILAHLSALPGLFSKSDAARVSPTLQGLGLLYGQRRKMTGYSNAWIGKAFEYAVADLFNHQAEPYYSLIRQGIESALATRVSPRVSKVSLDIDQLSCIRVAKESADTEDLVSAFGRFRIFEDARRGIENAAKVYPGLEDKVDVIFCERGADPAFRFAVLASLKANGTAFSQNNVRRDFLTFPIDLGITGETPRYRGVRFSEGVPVVHLPMHHVASGVHVWEMATEIVEKALIEGDRNAVLQFFRRFFGQDTPEDFWVKLLADRLQIDIGDVVQEIRHTLPQTPSERIVTVPVILGAVEDAVLDLVVP